MPFSSSVSTFNLLRELFHRPPLEPFIPAISSIIHHLPSAENQPTFGNDLTSVAMKGYERLFCWWANNSISRGNRSTKGLEGDAVLLLLHGVYNHLEKGQCEDGV